MENNSLDGNDNVSAVVSHNERSLSSLLFLSFGIFLLNSVNEIVTVRSGGNERGRSVDGSTSNVSEDFLLSLNNSVVNAFFDGDEGEGAAAAAPSVNGYLKLLMNIMNAYANEDEEEGGSSSELECLWSAYCHRLNGQARMGGMASTVARINSVGMRVILKAAPADAAAAEVVKALLRWTDVPCKKMFPRCKREEEN